MDEPMTPDGRAPQATFDWLTRTIQEELETQMAIHRLDVSDGVRATAALIADLIVRRFEVRERHEAN